MQVTLRERDIGFRGAGYRGYAEGVDLDGDRRREAGAVMFCWAMAGALSAAARRGTLSNGVSFMVSPCSERPRV